MYEIVIAIFLIGFVVFCIIHSITDILRERKEDTIYIDRSGEDIKPARNINHRYIPKSTTRYVIGICGGSASGKTSITYHFAKFLEDNGISVTIINQDNFYRSLSDTDDPTCYNFDDPSALDLDTLTKTCETLKYGENTVIPIYDFTIHRRTNFKAIYTADVIIVEGIFVFCDEQLRNLCDVKIFVNASPEMRFVRRIRRDQVERGRDFDSIVKQYMKYVKPAYDRYIQPCERLADIAIQNETHIEDTRDSITNFVGVDFVKTTLLHNIRTKNLI